MADITLFGIQELSPAVPTTYDCFASPNTALEQNNEVRLLIDTSLASPTINLPPISAFNGIWNIKLWLIDIANNASSNNIIVNANVGAGDLICNGLGGIPTATLTFDNTTSVWSITTDGKWFANGL
jgi:hypothetical protein